MELNDFISKENPWEYNFEFECGDKEYEENLDILERYFIYKIFPTSTVYEKTNKFIKEKFGFYPMSDPDGSGEASYPIIHEIYKRLWGWEKSEKTFGSIDNEIFADCLFGGDTMNSAQTVFNSFVKELIDEFQNLPDKKGNFSLNYILECWLSNGKFKSCLNREEKLKNFINAYHTLGNFVLVPKGFNTWRSRTFKDYWNRSLDYLKNEGFGEFKSDDFAKYVNYFFLWDYVKPKDYSVKPLSPKDNDIKAIKKFFVTAKDLIERRGKFMTAMLMIQTQNPALYDKIQTFLTNDEFSAKSIPDAAKQILEDPELGKKIPGNAKNLLDELK